MDIDAVNAVFAGLVVLSGSLVAIAANFEKLSNWWQKCKIRRDERKNAYLKSIIDNRFDEFGEWRKSIDEKIERLSDDLNDDIESTSSLMLDKMSRAYRFHCLEKHPISVETRDSMIAMFDRYKKRSYHNHIPIDFKKKIMECTLVGEKKEGEETDEDE